MSGGRDEEVPSGPREDGDYENGGDLDEDDDDEEDEDEDEDENDDSLSSGESSVSLSHNLEEIMQRSSGSPNS